MSEQDDSNERAASSRLEELGFMDEARLKKFRAHAGNAKLQLKFDQVFTASLESATRTLVRPASESAAPEEFELDLDGAVASGDEAMSDKELDLSDDGGELSLGDSPELAAALPVEEGLDLSLDDELVLSDSAPQTLAVESDLDLSLDEPAPEATMSGLALGGEPDLDKDVLAKLAEIDEIMTADATATMMRPAAESFHEGTDSGDELSIGESAELSLGESDELSLGEGDELLALDAGAELVGDLDLDGAPETGLEARTAPAESEIDDGALALGDDLVLGDSDALFSTESLGEEKAKVIPNAADLLRRAPPQAPSIADADEGAIAFEAPGPAPAPLAAAPKAAPPETPKTAPAAVPRVASTESERAGYREVVGHYNGELERLQATLTHLRNDREELLKKIEALEEERLGQHRTNVTLRAELDEKKIEVQIMKKRFTDETQELRYQLELADERRKLAEERGREYQAEIQNLQQKVRLEVKKVTNREAELEQRLELLKSDAETQIRHRDAKILELKRRIDSMEFEMDTLSNLEQKSLGAKSELEGKLDRAIKTLRTAIGILETDDPKLAALEKLKKGLDV